MKKIVFLLVFFLILGGGYFFRDQILEKIERLFYPLSLNLPQISIEIPEIKTTLQNPQVILPPPLRVEKEKAGFLTKEGIIEWTNFQRKSYGLSPLKENELLEQSANLKLQDMIEKHYFAHVSPDGIELKDLVEKVGYEFILIGENLALGNFKDDQDLVLAWMESPGHRENILNSKYQEIGVAVGQGIFEGKKVWFAVQHFGKPLSACPVPNENLKLEIEQNEKELDTLFLKIDALRKEIENYLPERSRQLKEKIKEYNDLVSYYNQLVKETQNLINQYNNQVKIYNECLAQ